MTPSQERVLRNFLDDDGRLHTIPSKHAKLLVVLDRLAQEFEPGQTYPEAEVNEVLQRFHPDHAALRRYLVENDFLTREDGSLLAQRRDLRGMSSPTRRSAARTGTARSWPTCATRASGSSRST